MNIDQKITDLIDEIRDDKIHGASELARKAANVLKVATEKSQALTTKTYMLEQIEIGQKLMSIRPTMASIFNIVNNIFNSLSEKSIGIDLDSAKQHMISRADKAIKDSLQAVAHIAEFNSTLINDSDRIMTHSYSSTIMSALRESFNKHSNIKVVTTRSNPSQSGERTAQELTNYGVSVTIIDDNTTVFHLKTINKVIVGADRICADGAIINGFGTFKLALASTTNGVPFFVLTEKLKFDTRLKSTEVELEEGKPSAAAPPVLPLPEAKASKPQFDITPLELITGMITEDGILSPREVMNLVVKIHH